ncbi:alpha/beta hydrolase [Angustibacter sp. McL0619]|uniref:alpha/beta hydrolase n=1 Tax=Angustibacter sp. McL0619 TaxID=3415676 RepID=UPI003CF89C94
MRTYRPAVPTAVAVGLALVLAIASVVTTGAGPAAAARSAPVAAQQLHWTPCPFPDAPAELQCASVAVPLDYAHPGGAKTVVTVDRLPAVGGPRVGSLVFNPGGPGGSGTEIVYGESIGAGFFSAGVRRHFDLIGLDPRGVGLSNPVKCDPAVFNARVSLFPKTEAGFRRLVAHNRAFGESCRRLTGPLLEHVDTLSAAKDIEALRQALGEGKLNYLGLSYGTQLGETYADLYPHRIRTMALDGALVHSLPATTLFADEETGYDIELKRFARWCDQTASCALHGRPVLPLFDRVVATADQHPIPASGCATNGCRPEVTGDDIRFNTQGLLLFKTPIPFIAPDGWNDLAVALAQAAAGDASGFSMPLASAPDDGAMNAGGLAVECLDWPDPIHTFADMQRYEAFGQLLSPRLRGASQSWTILAGCLGWPAPATNPPAPIEVTGTPPILLVNATHDPSTQYVWAQQMATELRTSVLVTRAGDGHTTYLTHGPSRTRDAIDRYLVTGRTPPPGTVYQN